MSTEHGEASHEGLDLNLKVWRQKDSNSSGQIVDYKVKNISPDMSFLEMMDELNSQLIKTGDEPVAFDHDCREGICGSCSMTINGDPHGPQTGTATCQLHMRHFKSGDTIVVEPFRAAAFPVVKDLFIDRSAFDNIITAGGFISSNVGSAPEANSILVPKEKADLAMDAAACIGCGACVAVCKNASAMLFVAAKVSHLTLLPQGHVERETRVMDMMEAMDKAGFGACSNTQACSAACPKEIKFDNIARLNREYNRASVSKRS